MTYESSHTNKQWPPVTVVIEKQVSWRGTDTIEAAKGHRNLLI